MANHDVVKGGEDSVVPERTVRSFAALSEKVKAVASPEFARFLGDVEQVMSADVEKRIAEITTLAAERPPLPQ